MLLKYKLIILLFILFICSTAYAQQGIITIDEKGIVSNGSFVDVFRIKTNKNTYVYSISVDTSCAIIIAYERAQEGVLKTLYFFDGNNFYNLPNAAMTYEPQGEEPVNLNSNNLTKRVSEIFNDSVFNHYFKSNLIITSIFSNKLLMFFPTFIYLHNGDSLKEVVESHGNIKGSITASFPYFFDKGTKMAYLDSERYNPQNRFVVFFDLINQQKIKQIPVSSETTRICVSEDGNEVLLLCSDKKTETMMLNVYWVSVSNVNEMKYIGYYKAAFFDNVPK